MKVLIKYILIVIFIGSCQKANYSKDSMISYEKGIEHLKQATLNTGINGYNEALTDFNESVDQDSTNISSRWWKIHCEIELGKTEDALKTSNSTIELLKGKNHSLKPYFYQTSGIIEKINENDDKAQAYFTEAISIYEKRLRRDKNNYDAIMNISTILCYAGQKNKAIEFLNSIPENEQIEDAIQQIRTYIQDFEIETELNRIKTRGNNGEHP